MAPRQIPTIQTSWIRSESRSPARCFAVNPPPLAGTLMLEVVGRMAASAARPLMTGPVAEFAADIGCVDHAAA